MGPYSIFAQIMSTFSLDLELVLIFFMTQQKYRLGKQSGKEMGEQSKDGKLPIKVDNMLFISQ